MLLPRQDSWGTVSCTAQFNDRVQSVGGKWVRSKQIVWSDARCVNVILQYSCTVLAGTKELQLPEASAEPDT